MRCAVLLLAALALSAPAFAQPVGRDDQAFGLDVVGVAFGPDAEAAIRSYYRDHPAEPEGLPPGIAMNLGRGKPLPPGIAKRSLPDDLRSLLPAYPGHEIIVADDDVLLVATATQLVVDILSDVL